MNSTNLQNFAFISYNHRDSHWAKWIRRKLEWYRLPSDYQNEFKNSRYIRPVFRDRDELDSGVLSKEIRKRLETSKFLIVICSPNSANSIWVSEEIKTFIDIGKAEFIIPFVVKGRSYKYKDRVHIQNPQIDECYPYALRYWNMMHPEDTLLRISLFDDGENNKEKAFIRVVSRMLGVSFDSLWKRHERDVRLLIYYSSLIVSILLLLTYWYMIPIKVGIYIKDQPCNLPCMNHAVLDIDGNEYTMSNLDTLIWSSQFPGYYRLKRIPISFCVDKFYENYQNIYKLSFGTSSVLEIQAVRDKTFAYYAGIVYFETTEAQIMPLQAAIVKIGSKSTITDSCGYFIIDFDLSEQSVNKPIIIEHDGYQTIIRDDESPNIDLKYIMHEL